MHAGGHSKICAPRGDGPAVRLRRAALKNARRFLRRPHVGRRRNAERFICRKNDIRPRRRNIDWITWGLLGRLRGARGFWKRVLWGGPRLRDCASVGHSVSPGARRERELRKVGHSSEA
jgi:hypothetical protein